MRAGRARGRDGLAPDVLLQAIHFRERGLDRGHVRNLPVDVEPRLEVPAKALPKSRL